MLDWEKLKPKRIQELEKENAALFYKIFKLEDENKDLKDQLYSSDLIIAEYEGRVLALKAEIKELILKTNNNAMQNSIEINNCPPSEHNARGAGRKSRVDEKTLELINSLQRQGLSHREIAQKLTETTGKPSPLGQIYHIKALIFAVQAR